MRYLNKIILINSSNIAYSEIEIDGNVHLIGDQGSGKSTLLRAILFFYNADKMKLGISKEKKGFDDYYFAYQNSYIVYEIVKDDTTFCVLAYKVNGKVAFIFFDSAYKKTFFVDQNSKAFPCWDNIRNAFGKDIHYSKITSYGDFRKIIYGDNKGLKYDFRKYALIESKQFENIPRTIQNVFLNSNLEAKFIKDTIINSLDDDEFVIDIENYAKNHLPDFETQINDIKIWFKKNKQGQITIRNQANRVIDKHRDFNLLNQEKKKLIYKLASRMEFIESEKPILSSHCLRENEALNKLTSDKKQIKEAQRKREQSLISKIDSYFEKLEEAKRKQYEYDNLKIHKIIKKVALKDTLTNEQKFLNEEKNLLSSQFAEISQKYQAIISQVKTQCQEFNNNQQAKINNIDAGCTKNKEDIIRLYQTIIKKISVDGEYEKETVTDQLNLILEEESKIKNKKAELKHKTFFIEEIKAYKTEKDKFNETITEAKIIIQSSKQTLINIQKEWGLDVKEVERNHKIAIEKESENRQSISGKIQAIETKIKQSQSSLYGWLNDNYTDWEDTIGKVIDEENVLFNTELNPKLIARKATTLFGIELNLNTLSNRVKTVKEYHQEIEVYQKQVADIGNKIEQLNSDKNDNLQKLKNKFNKQIKQLKDAITENKYAVSQNEYKLKKNKVNLAEYKEKAQQVKNKNSQELENKLEELASQKQRVRNNLDGIKNEIKQKITSKENKKNTEIQTEEKVKNEKINKIQANIIKHEVTSKKRIEDTNKEQSSELNNKGANTKRLNEIEVKLTQIENDLDYIKNNERTVFDYEKDKRELFDKVPQIKEKKVNLEKKKTTITEEHNIELNKINSKLSNQEENVKSIKSKLEEFKNDLIKFDSFKKSEVFTNIQEFHTPDERKDLKTTETADSIIVELTDKYYEGGNTLQALRKAIDFFTNNFNEHNIFSFKVKPNNDTEYLKFADELEEFIEEDKINEFEKRVNERFAHIIHVIAKEATELNSKEAEIEKIIKKINDDFVSKNFVHAIKEMEIRTQDSSNPIVQLLVKIKEFNDENDLLFGQKNLFTSTESNSKNQKAVELLKQLVKELERTKQPVLTLSESFDLQFRIVENDNDSGWVEKISNVGSEGTDVLVKAMINILLLNVFKDSASKKFKDFKLHCMMDEIGRLHPNNVKGILRFANERNILLINGSPISQNATDYKFTYKLAKEQSKSDNKKYITKVIRLIKKVNTKTLN